MRKSQNAKYKQNSKKKQYKLAKSKSQNCKIYTQNIRIARYKLAILRF